MFLLGLGLSFFSGSIITPTATVVLLLLLLLTALGGYLPRLHPLFAPIYTNIAVPLQLLFGLLCGMAWGAGNAYSISQWQLPAELIGQTTTAQLQVTRITEEHPGYWRLHGELQLAHPELTKPALARLNWYQPADTQRQPQAGESWQLQVRLRHPQGQRNQGGFFYHRYLLSQNIRVLGTIVSAEWQSGDANLRQRLFNQLQQNSAELPHGGILLALLLGERQQLNNDHWWVFQRTGLAHLIAISGLHLTLVAGAAVLLVRALGWPLGKSRRGRDSRNLILPSYAVALLIALAYSYLAGFATATLRALLMLSVVFVHKLLANRTTPARILLRAATVVVLVEPMAPLQSGFWLSVLAVTAIIVMNWRWSPIRGKWAALRMLWRLEWVLTLALWPLTAWWFGGVALLAPLTNLLMIPVFTFWILPLALFALVLQLAQLQSFSAALLALAHWPLELSWAPLQWVADQSWQWLSSELINGGSIIVLLLFAFIPVSLRWRAVGIITVLIGLHLAQLLRAQQSDFYLHVLDVEQGSAIVIERQGFALLIDTGAAYASGANMGERTVIPFLQSRQLQPELGFISHSDNDHQGGAEAIVTAYPAIRWFGADIGSSCSAGQQGQWRGVHWQVLHPRRETRNQANDDSCVLMIRYGTLRILVPGDIERRGERDLLAFGADVRADILVLAHHGSNSSNEDYFLRHVRPALAVASRGRNNPYKLVHPAVRQRLSELHIPLLETAWGGQITVRGDGRSWSVEQPWSAALRPWFDAESEGVTK